MRPAAALSCVPRRSPPRTTQNKGIDEDARQWFFMGAPSEPVDDPAKKRALWSKMNEAWFPAGPDDPTLRLVQVKITHASYWDVKDSKLVQLFKMARAAVTGKPPTDMGAHADLRLR